jgi:DNA invertase Pin-like site-specific DNA recombinase
MDAYSYIRWSSKKQTEGDSFNRQTESARRVCIEKGWNLIDLPPDAGVSSFKGKNLSHKGILGQFIRKIEKGEISTPCVLIIEKLDRFSRREVDDILPIFLDLIKRGVEVYSTMDNDHYTSEKIKADPMINLIKLVMGFVSANNYSKTIGIRIAAAKKRKRELALTGKKVWMFDCCPQYFDWDKSKEIYIPNHKSKHVELIYNRFLETKSLLSVVKYLNENNVKPFQTAKHWAATTVKDILTARQVLGEFKGVKNYYPRIISDDKFNQAQYILKNNRQGKGTIPRLFNILHGILYCKTCGKPAVQVSNKTMTRYHGCKRKYSGTCSVTRVVRTDILEQTLFGIVLQLSPTDLLKDIDKQTSKDVQVLQGELITIDKEIHRLIELDGIGLDIIRTKLEGLKKRQDDVRIDLQKKMDIIRQPMALGSSVSRLRDLVGGSDDGKLDQALRSMNKTLLDDSIRRKLREPLSNLVDRVVCDFERATYRVHYKTGVISDEVYLGD